MSPLVRIIPYLCIHCPPHAVSVCCSPSDAIRRRPQHRPTLGHATECRVRTSAHLPFVHTDAPRPLGRATMLALVRESQYLTWLRWLISGSYMGSLESATVSTYQSTIVPPSRSASASPFTLIRLAGCRLGAQGLWSRQRWSLPTFFSHPFDLEPASDPTPSLSPLTATCCCPQGRDPPPSSGPVPSPVRLLRHHHIHRTA